MVQRSEDVPPCAISAQAILGILLASATVTSMRGFLAGMPTSHGLADRRGSNAVTGATA
jgi:hypothetical protein